MFVASALLLLTLVVGITHAAIVVSNNSRNMRIHVVTVGDLDRNGREMVTTMPTGEGVIADFYVVVAHDHVERLSQRQLDRRDIRATQLVLDNWQGPAAGATEAQVNANARMRAEVEAELAAARTQFRQRNNSANTQGIHTFFSIYVGPIALLAIAIAVFALYKSGKSDNN